MRQKLFLPVLILLLLSVAFIAGQNFQSKQSGSKTSAENSSVASSAQKTSDDQTNSSSPANSDEVTVTKVVDGDTIEIEGGQKVRYIGIDTPETVDPRKTVQCFGVEASNKNKELVLGKKVKLVKDVSETDKYGRLLRYVYVGNTFVNDYLVANGFARASSYPPDVKYQDQFKKSESAAREKNLGLWNSCSVSGASTSQSYQVNLSRNSDCKIKGNISSSGEKIYHVPGGSYYDKTSIDTSKGERWFCTEDEAKAAGWRASKV